MAKDRYLHSSIISDLKEKMVFIGGPRQVGKTTLARFIGESDYERFAYLNWDSREDRKAILDGVFRADAGLVIFDEIHKYKRWKNYIKGEYDIYKDKFHILVTGSARMDIYRRGGDSLMGRYHHYRLHPFSVTEALGHKPAITVLQKLVFPESADISRSVADTFSDIMALGGFPEPFLKKDQKTLRRFRNERLDRLIKEDIRDIEHIRDISALQVLGEILPQKVGSLLSINALREDLQVNHKTMSVWMDILERFYYHFRIYPYRASTIKSLRKEPKMYLWDWSDVPSEGARLENIVASHLLKTAHFLHDAEGYNVDVHFLRDIDGREVDFLVTADKKPWFAVEVKSSDEEISKHLLYFREKLKIPFSYQLINTPETMDYWKENVRVMSVQKFLTGLM